MLYFFDAVYADPLFFIGAFFSVCAAIAFLIFLRGFSAGIGNVFTQEGHAGHLHHYRVRATWGLLLLALIFIVWEIVRFITDSL